MRNLSQRVLAVSLAVTIGTAGGAIAGHRLGRTLTGNQTQLRVAHSADQLLAGGESAIRESRAVLEKMNASPYSICSGAEADYFRKLIFESRNLKDAGRIRDSKIACSTTLGSAPANQLQLRPDFTQKDGALVYRDLPIFRIGNRTVITVQVGNSYVVYNPYGSGAVLAPNMHYTVTDVDAATQKAGHLLGETSPIQLPGLTRNDEGQLHGNLFATRCSAKSSICVTAYMPVSQALGASGPEVALFEVLGAFAGGLIGFVCSLFFHRKRGIERQLIRAIRRDALRVVYQPIVDLKSGEIVEAEALVRWTNEENHAISPDDFVKVAEHSGFVGEITRLVVRHVLRDFGYILRTQPGFRVNVNIAAPDLEDPEFVPMLENALSAAGLAPESLGIEITESFTARQQAAKETILQLRRLGHFVHIDDFGTGYSSLAYLHDLSVDSIKIDKAFTKAIGTDAVTVSILPQILTMAETLGLRVVVEGIETPQQARYFASARQAIYAQGWLFGRPVPVDDFRRLLRENASEKNAGIEKAVVASAFSAA